MSQLQKRIHSDLIAAMKGKESDTVSVLRMLNAGIKNKEIEKKEIEEADVLQVIKHEVKKREEAAKAFMENGRKESQEQEEKELGILQKYLPKELSDEELKIKIEEILKLQKPENFGQAMQKVMPELKDKANGNRIKQFVESYLV